MTGPLVHVDKCEKKNRKGPVYYGETHTLLALKAKRSHWRTLNRGKVVYQLADETV